MKPKELLFSRQYYEAVSAIKRHMNNHPNDNYYSLLGDAQLCLKHYRDALLSYKRSQEMEQLMGSFSSLNQILISHLHRRQSRHKKRTAPIGGLPEF